MMTQNLAMKMLYKSASIVYRLVLTLAILALLLGNFLSAVAGHNTQFNWTDYLLFAYLIVTVATLTIYTKIETEDLNITVILFFLTAALITTGILLVLYELYDSFFICNCYSGEDTVISILLFAFIVISTILLVGLIRRRKAIVKSPLG